MSLLPIGRPSYRWFAITLIAAAALYGWYVMVEYERLNELNQRQLANTAADLKATLDTALETVHRFDAKSKDTQAAGSEPAGTSGQTPRSKLCDFDASQPYLDVAACARQQSTPAVLGPGDPHPRRVRPGARHRYR